MAQFSDYLKTTSKKYPTKAGVSSAYDANGNLINKTSNVSASSVIQPANKSVVTGNSVKAIQPSTQSAQDQIKALQAQIATKQTELAKQSDIEAQYGATPKTMSGDTGYTSSINLETGAEKKKTALETYSDQLTETSQKYADLNQASLKNTEQERLNTIAQIQAETQGDTADLQAAYADSESQINEAISLLGAQFGVSGRKVQAIVDSQRSLFNSFQTGLTKLKAQEKQAIASADLTAAKSAVEQQKNLLDFQSNIITKQMEIAQQEETNAREEVAALVDSGAIADSDDQSLIDLAETSGYDVYTLARLREAVKAGNAADAEKAKAELEYTKSQTAKAQAEATETWSEPYSLGGDIVQKNSRTGEVRTAVNVASGGTDSTLEAIRLMTLQKLMDATATSPGQIVNAATERPADLTAAQIENFQRYDQYLTQLVPKAESYLSEDSPTKVTTGAIEGAWLNTVQALPGLQASLSTSQNDLLATIATMNNQLIYMLSGKQINEQEYERLKKQLPDVGLTNAQNMTRLSSFKTLMKQAQDKQLSLMGLKIKGGETAGATAPVTPTQESGTSDIPVDYFAGSDTGW